MSLAPNHSADLTADHPMGQHLRGVLSSSTLCLALLVLAATFFLMSPPSDQGYPGALPWGENSILHLLTEWFSFDGHIPTVRGVEIKQFVLHLAVVLGLAILAARALVSLLYPPRRKTALQSWFAGQTFLAGWAVLSFASAWWSGDAALSMGQAALYALALAWAISLGWNLESRDLPRLLWGYVYIASLGAVLCIWYYYGRNPFHRPGFPIGNPNALAACILPAILICGFIATGAIQSFANGAVAAAWRRLTFALLPLLPLLWCFALVWARAAMIGLIAGIAGLLFLHARTRVRWGIAFLGLIAIGAGIWYLSAANHDFTMGRSATIRFRMYAWRYAAVLWGQRPISGVGAGSFPRLASALAVTDRFLDPAAFMGDMVEHAHNELFEVFTEIGLVGGVTFVAGYLATLVAAAAALRQNWSPERRWLMMGLVASVIALLADSLFGVNLRLPGTPAVFYTLLGGLWALARSVSKLPAETGGAEVVQSANTRRSRYALMIGALLGAVFAGGLAIRDWDGARKEFQSQKDLRSGKTDEALREAEEAEGALLDPVRILAARLQTVEVCFAQARDGYRRVMSLMQPRTMLDSAGGLPATSASAPTQTQPNAGVPADWSAATDICFRAYESAVGLDQQMPNVGRMPALAAQAAEMASDLFLRAGDSQNAAAWQDRAFRSWQLQQAWRPFDLQTLLRLTDYWPRYRAIPGDYAALLRDALRAGFPPAEWHAALQRIADVPQFDVILAAMRAVAGPYDPATDVDTLVISRAPEIYRFCAAWKALKQDWQGAVEDAGAAAALYQPLRSRFPELYSVSLAEQADYAAKANPEDTERPIVLLRAALEALPTIQLQKYEWMARPYRIRLARAYKNAGEIQAATQLIKQVLAVQPNNYEARELILESVLEHQDVDSARAVLQSAESAGITGADLERLRDLVRRQLPEALTDSPPTDSKPAP